ncbi:MAG: hypothetical protein BWY52_03278 [Chloroflexi bacterium ADurb.Bin325]|nr:MAG: hypothetical protein BWY52_03278 [Chloroflexi bacterium ADurb.Bin325]
MDFGKAFTYVFEDPDWLRKLGIGTLLMLVGILFSWLIIGLIPLIIVTGYTLVVMRNVSNGDARPLPEWEDWGGLFVLGLKLFVALFIWLLPAFIIMVPIMIGSVLAGGSGGDSSAGAATAFASMLTICGSCLMILWSLIVALFEPAIYVRIAHTERISSAFEFARLWSFTRRNLGDIIIAILLVWLAGIIASIVGMLGFVALLVGALITIPGAMVWQYLVQSHLFGQIAARDRASSLAEVEEL